MSAEGPGVSASPAGPTVSPCLWFEDEALEAAGFYVGLFPNSRIIETIRFGEAGPGPAGSLMAVTFTLAGQRLTALNGRPAFGFNPSISLVATCRTQGEIDRLWDGLLEGGTALQCGWLTDRFGVSWQIVPEALTVMLKDDDGGRVMRAMLQMVRLDIAGLERAHRG